MSQDTLSEVLRSVRLRGAVFYHVGGGREWAAEAPAAREIAAAVMPGVEHVMEYHVVTRGSCWAAIVGQSPVRLATGDIVVFPHGDPHVMASAPGLRPQPADAAWMIATRNDPKPIPVSLMGVEQQGADPLPEDAPTILVCGFLGCDLKPFNPLVANLPRLLHVPAAGSSGWVAAVLTEAVRESRHRRPGADAMLERLSEMMFVDAVRRYAEELPPSAGGWLAGLRDRHVGRALAALHHEPTREWSMEELGREAGLSRSALHERFVAMTGQPPMQYLANWRMQLAANLLCGSHATVAAIALEVGYDSEAAFARAFKRLVGMPPAAWRRRQRGEATTVSARASS